MSLFSNIFTKMFSSRHSAIPSKIIDFTEEKLEGIIKTGGFHLSYTILQEGEDAILIELEGEDEGLLKKREGHFLDAFQFFIKKTLQHKFPDKKIPSLQFDSKGFRDNSYQNLLSVVDKLKGMALKNRKSVYLKPLSPKARRMVHRHLSDDRRVKTQSIGNDYYKKMKIIPLGHSNFKSRSSYNQRRRNR